MAGAAAPGERGPEETEEETAAPPADGAVHQEQLRVPVISSRVYADQRGPFYLACDSVSQEQRIRYFGASVR